MMDLSTFERSGLVLLAVLIVQPLPLSPATIIVGGSCTLVDAIEAANSDSPVGDCPAGSGADTVRLTGDVVLDTSFSGINGLPSISSEIVIEGQGHTVSRDAGAPSFRFLNVTSGSDLEVRDLTLTNGRTEGFNEDGGAILNNGTLTTDNVQLVGNEASRNGGGLSNNSVATIINSTIGYNTAFDWGGGVYSDFGASTTVVDSTLVGNYTFFEGSGLFSYTGNVTISGSTISGNEDGGLVVFYVNYDVVVTNSTISGNGGDGMVVLGGGGYVKVYNSTLAHNSSNDLYGYTYNVGDNIFRNNVFGYSNGVDCNFDTFVDGGGNLDTDGSCSGGGSLTGLDPVLADNGGPTQTHALLAGSSAIDSAGDCGLAVDQRGYGRSGDCDSGAFEFEGPPAVGASVGNLTPRGARCGNLTAGGSVSIFDATSWNCREAGLTIDSGDRVRQTVRGRPTSTQLTGTVEGVLNGRVLCQNFQTGQSIQFALGGETSFNCREQGLDFSLDNLIGWTVTGIAD